VGAWGSPGDGLLAEFASVVDAVRCAVEFQRGMAERNAGTTPETYLRFIVNGRFGPNQGIAGVILKPWNERTRSAQQLKPLMLAGEADRVPGRYQSR